MPRCTVTTPAAAAAAAAAATVLAAGTHLGRAGYSTLITGGSGGGRGILWPEVEHGDVPNISARVRSCSPAANIVVAAGDTHGRVPLVGCQGHHERLNNVVSEPEHVTVSYHCFHRQWD